MRYFDGLGLLATILMLPGLLVVLVILAISALLGILVFLALLVLVAQVIIGLRSMCPGSLSLVALFFCVFSQLVLYSLSFHPSQCTCVFSDI